MKDGLAPHCAGCHATWFISTDAFVGEVVQGRSGDFSLDRAVVDRAFVTAGDPHSSLLVELLEGRGPDSYGDREMPPVGFGGTNTYFAERSANGETAVTMEQVRDWIEVMEVGPCVA